MKHYALILLPEADGPAGAGSRLVKFSVVDQPPRPLRRLRSRRRRPWLSDAQSQWQRRPLRWRLRRRR